MTPPTPTTTGRCAAAEIAAWPGSCAPRNRGASRKIRMRLIPPGGVFNEKDDMTQPAYARAAPLMQNRKLMPNRKMSSELSIRFVTRQDHEQWLPLWDGYNAFYGRAGATALAPEITAMTWARFFDADEPIHGLVAESDGRLLGLTHFLFHRTTPAIAP